MSDLDRSDKVKSAALTFLTRRRLTAFELKEKLNKKGFDKDECDEAAEYFTQMGYINDLDYAQRFILDSIELKRHGTVRIKQDLTAKGIERDVIDDAILSCEVDNLKTLRLLAEERLSRLDISDEKAKNSFIRFLLRKGFRFDEINTVLRERDVECFD